MLASRVSARCVSAKAPFSVARNVRPRATQGPSDKEEVKQKIPVGLSDEQAQQVKDSLTPRAQELEDIVKRGGEKDAGDMMRFDGPLPEVLNGRLAMLGFTACLAAEYATHRTVFEQVMNEPLGIAIAGLTLLVATVIPIYNGSKIVDNSSGPDFEIGNFNFTNELINGRAAMVGFAIILAYETVSGAPIFR